MLPLLYIEAFWLIPKWNRWSERRRGDVAAIELRREIRREMFPERDPKSKLRDLALYTTIAVVLVSIIIVYKVFQPGEPELDWLPPGRWTGLGVETLLVFGYYFWVGRSDWGRLFF